MAGAERGKCVKGSHLRSDRRPTTPTAPSARRFTSLCSVFSSVKQVHAAGIFRTHVKHLV